VARDLLRGLRRILWGFILTALLSLAVGYVLFLTVFPTIAFPASGEAPLPLVFLVLAVSAVAAGFASEDLGMGIAAVVISIVGGIAAGGFIALSPLVEGLYLVDPSSIFGFLVHYGFVVLILSFVVNFVGVLVGYGVRERYVVQRPLQRPLSLAESVARHRK
jgi:hypothetical protein